MSLIDTILYDSDEEPPPPPLETNLLSWRLPAEYSLSDWTIEIANDSTPVIDSYHVHKCLLGAGGRKSEYFSRLFQEEDLAELESSTSRIKLNTAAAKAFPALLDYLYSDAALEITTENAAALHHLGQYFEVPRLRWEAKQFWQKNISVENCGFYFTQARLFRDSKLSNAVVDVCVSEIYDIRYDNAIIEASDPELWLDVVKKVRPDASTHLSILLATFFRLRCGNIDMRDFLELTKEEYLPEIHITAATDLLSIEANLIGGCEENDSLQNSLSSLQERCIRILSKYWHRVDMFDDNERNQAILAKQTPYFLTRLMVASFMDASSEVQELRKSLAREKSKNKTLRKNNRLVRADSLRGSIHSSGAAF